VIVKRDRAACGVRAALELDLSPDGKALRRQLRAKLREQAVLRQRAVRRHAGTPLGFKKRCGK
jgi:hypothetical protein